MMNLLFESWTYGLLFLTSIVSIAGVSALAYGYRASLYNEDPIARLFAMSLMFLALGYITRRLAWDVVMPIIYDVTYFNPANMIFNVINMIAVYVGLRARWMMMPEEDRYKWHWYSAWMYPGVFRMRIKVVMEKDPNQ